MFGELPKKVGSFVLKYRWPIIIINNLLMVLLIYGMINRVQIFGEHQAYMKVIQNNPLAINEDHESVAPIFDADYHVWFDDDNPELLAYDEFQKIFSKDDNLIIVVVSKSGDIFTNDNLKSLKYLTDQSWQVPYISRVDGLTNFNYTYVHEDELLVEDFINTLPLDENELQHKKNLALNDPLMPHFLVSPKADITQIQLRAIIPRDFPDGYLEAKETVDAIAAKIQEAYQYDEQGNMLLDKNGDPLKNDMYNPDLEIKLGGTVVLNTAFKTFAEDDIQNLMPLMILFIMIVLAISIRSFWGTTLPMGVLVTSVLVPITLFVGWFGFSLNNATVNVMQMLVAVSIADSVHVLAIFFRGLRHGLDKNNSVIYTIEKNFLPCLITSITTSIGFFSLTLQDIPPFQDLGLFAGVGTLYAFLATIFTLPAFLSLVPFKQRPVDLEKIKEKEESGYEKLTDFIVRYQKPVRWVAAISAVLAIYYIFQIKIDNTSVKFFAEHTHFRQATDYIDNNIIGVNPIEFRFDSGEENGIYNPEFLKGIEKFQRYINDHPEYGMTYVSGITDIVKRINKTMHQDDPAYYKIPEDSDSVNANNLIAQYMLLYQMSLPQGMELTNQIDIQNRSTRVTAFAKSYSSFELLRHTEKIEQWIRENIPASNAIAVGVPVMFGRLFTVAIPSILQSIVISLVFITLVLMITFKSVRVGLFSMIPNVWPILVVFGIIGLMGVSVNMSVAIVGMITLGIAVDDSVHYITKYLRGIHEGLNQKNAILYAFRQVGAPLVFTSIILIFGFGALTQSDFVVNSDMALYSSIVIAMALFADFILLPATILKFDKTKA
jgi:hypothetical protein